MSLGVSGGLVRECSFGENVAWFWRKGWFVTTSVFEFEVCESWLLCDGGDPGKGGLSFGSCPGSDTDASVAFSAAAIVVVVVVDDDNATVAVDAVVDATISNS